jgi:hypothetical protein
LTVDGTVYYRTMHVEKIVPVLPTDDLAGAVAAWSALLGAEPTFVDGDRWAQFDVGGSRVALAGADKTTERPAVMVKVDDLAAARDTAVAAGLVASPVARGGHELRCQVESPDGWVAVLYAPLPD